jgi:mRNA-degrading endonuclease RelE of RelBE toxin-antitoxin system
MYKAVLGRKAERSLKKIPRDFQGKIKSAILNLEENPFCFGTIKLVGYPVASFRHRVGDYWILFEVWEEKKKLLISDIKRRTSTTY